MSRCPHHPAHHRGRPRHAEPRRPTPPTAEALATDTVGTIPADEPRPAEADTAEDNAVVVVDEVAPEALLAPGALLAEGADPAVVVPADAEPVRPPAPRPAARAVDPRVPPSAPAAPPTPRDTSAPDAEPVERACTAPQLRRFIKSRAYVPMHELRRRFGLVTEDDDVTPVDLGGHRIFVGLREREGRLLGELFRAGDVGYELSIDPATPIVIGVFPMRPVTRQ